MIAKIILLIPLLGFVSSLNNESRGDNQDNFNDQEYDYQYAINDYHSELPPTNHTNHTEPKYNEDKPVNQIHRHHEVLVSLFGSSEEVKDKIYADLLDFTTEIGLAKAILFIKIRMKNTTIVSKLNESEKLEIEEVVKILNRNIDIEAYPEYTADLLKALVREGVEFSDVLSEDDIVHMVEHLFASVERQEGCNDYGSYLVTIWLKIVKSAGDTKVDILIRSILNILKALKDHDRAIHPLTHSYIPDDIEAKARLLSLLSTGKSMKFAIKAFGGIQQLEDMIKTIFCKPLNIETVKKMLTDILNATTFNSLFSNPDEMQAFFKMQQTLTEITTVIEQKHLLPKINEIQGTSIGQLMLSSYMELADKAVSLDKADVWAQMSLEEANTLLYKMLLSNENYVGTMSSIVLTGDVEENITRNYTLEKDSITVSVSEMKLTENKKLHAQFQYEDTLIKTDSWDLLDANEGNNLQVYALRYKSWSQMIKEIVSKHYELENLNSSSSTNHSRKARSVGSLDPEFNTNKSFIGKGGVVSLSTQQSGVKKSVPVTYWIGFQEAASQADSSSPLVQCLSCEYLDNRTLTWETRGCYVASVDDKGITCKCNHTTNFAAFVMPGEIKYDLTDTMKQVQRLLSIVGSALSVVGLILSLVVFFFVRNLVRNERLKAHTQLSIALLAVHVLFLGGELFVRNQTICVATAVLSHYFLLASFLWMLIEGIFLYLYVIQVFLRSKIVSYSWMYFVGWVLPLLIVTIAAAIGIHYDVYVTPKKQKLDVCPSGSYAHMLNKPDTPKYEMCWLSTESGLIWSFLGPALLVLLFNTVIMGRTLKICIESSRNTNQVHSRSSSLPSTEKYNSSGISKSFDSSRHYDSSNHPHGDEKSSDAQPYYVVSASPCLLQVMTEEERCKANECNEDDSVSGDAGNNADQSNHEKPITSFSSSDAERRYTNQTRYHSVSGDSARLCNSRAPSVVYRNSVSQTPKLQIKAQAFGNKMAHLADRSQFFQDAKATVKGAIVLLPILGVPWICGFLAHLSPVFTYLFIILNSTQGIFIFVVYCVKNGEVRRAIQRRMHTRSLKHSVDAGIRRTSSTSTVRGFLRFGRRRSTMLSSA